MVLSREQKRVLLHKYLTGDFPGQKWETVNALFNKGLIAEDGKRIKVTPAGAEYCNNHHLMM